MKELELELRCDRRSGWFCMLAAVSVGLAAPIHVSAAVAVAAEEAALEEVIVTARKVRENVRDIPLSVQVLTGEQLDAADLSRLSGTCGVQPTHSCPPC